jgi:ribonuclease T2
MRFALLSFFFLSALFANTILFPTQCCPAYNNLKHTYNTGNVYLDTTKRYEIKQHHKGQYLIRVPGASPQQRWVDESCLAPKNKLNVAPASCEVKPIQSKSQKRGNLQISSENLLALSWHNAFCETHRSKKECKRGWKSLLGNKAGDDNFVLHGLWPQPREKVYCNVPRRYITADKHKQWNKLPEPDLTRKTKAKLREVMPGIDSNLHRHEWIKHGTCYGTDAQSYFEDAIALTQTVRGSKISKFFKKYTSKRVSLTRIRELFDESFGKGAGSRVELRCNRGMITELWLHLGRGGQSLEAMLKEGRKVHSRCTRGIIDAVGFER